jgi:molybdopterin-containing oxidoreductase family iron-sulfur binding subunit
MRWSGDDRAYHDVLRSNWKDRLFPSQTRYANFDEFWDNSLHEGVFASEEREPAPADINLLINLSAAVNRIAQVAAPPAGSVGLVLYEPVALRNGAHANNPWLQELPDPVSKITWDNYVNVSPKVAREMEIEEGSVIRFKRGYVTIELPAHIQPGQHDSCFSIALGYGRTRGGRVAEGIGANAYPFASFVNGSFDYHLAAVAYEKTGEKVKPATTQPHHSLDGRPIVHDLGLADYLAGAGVEGNGHGDKATSIWKEYEYPEHKWGLAIDLNACVGCSACLLSCQAENNVPVVGKAEVQRQREMHWIRVDRYFEGSEDNPATYYQPVMCMQCDNASCESVCPVLATVHSSEGLNMQVYNRCVGTRYCSNNCPYKVRRFNWFEHDHSDPIANLALNPDVTVRTRGVMEKCTFCVQRIQEVKIRARNENRPIRDGEIQPACQQSCPADAIVFGDLVDPESRVSRLKRDRRDYVLLEELNLKPATSYLAKVRNDAGAGEGDIG